jgi:hypothetical protein
MTTSQDINEKINEYSVKMREYTEKLKNHQILMAERNIEILKRSIMFDRIGEEMDEINQIVTEELKMYDEQNFDILLFIRRSIELEERSMKLVEEKSLLDEESLMTKKLYEAQCEIMNEEKKIFEKECGDLISKNVIIK